MSSKRNLKKEINNTIELLYVDCVFYKVYVVDADKDAADKVIIKITECQNEFLQRINVTEGKDVKGRIKAYYKKLRSDFQDQINIIAKDIASLG